MKRFYCTATWHGWPEGGSYGTIVRAENSVAAEIACKLEMAAVLAEERELCWHCGADTDDGEGFDGLCGSCADINEEGELDPDDAAKQRVFAEHADDWHMVDCFDVDEFITQHRIA